VIDSGRLPRRDEPSTTKRMPVEGSSLTTN
jgi:hypothetical protein